MSIAYIELQLSAAQTDRLRDKLHFSADLASTKSEEAQCGQSDCLWPTSLALG